VEPWREGDQIQLKGQEAGELTRLAQQVAAEMRQVPGAVDVDLSTKGQKPELEVQVDRGLAGSLGITVGQVAQALRPALPASTSATGSIPQAKPATSRSASHPRRAPWWPISSRCRSSYPDRTGRGRFRWGRSHASRPAWGRRASTTSIATA
jgi:hypothetical protein